MEPLMTDFDWHDGERVIRFGETALDHLWDDAELLTTERAQADVPRAAAGSRHGDAGHVPAGAVPDVAADLAAKVGGDRLVAWGGGRVIDVAKAIASARGGSVCAVPTTLSGAEMSSGHRTLAGIRGPATGAARAGAGGAAADDLGAGPALRSSAMNALGHAMEALYVPSRNPVATLAGLRAAALMAEGIEQSPDGGESLALGSILAGYALGSTELSLHHVVCQTIVRVCSTPHAATNAVMLPHTTAAIAGFAPDPDGAAGRGTGCVTGRDAGSHRGAGRWRRLAARAWCGARRARAGGRGGSAAHRVAPTRSAAQPRPAAAAARAGLVG